MSFHGLKVGILQTGTMPDALHRAHSDYDIMCRDLVGASPITTDSYRVFDNEFPEDVRDADIWVITGSRFSVLDGDEWIARLEGFIQAAYASDSKIVGICFGHQILAQALGGQVAKRRGDPVIGLERYDLLNKDGEAAPLSLHAWHFDQVETAPAQARVIMTSKDCHYAGLLYADRAVSFQPHPEFSSQYMRDLITIYAGNGLAHDLARPALASLTSTPGSDVIAAKLKDYLNIA
ncbi:type 1 glutamine amidotransferase [Pacificimonas sp. WHA3]|uniref:Type 1 glutamine amidotransferase n=1 Tax=Pacificimonas pallii TaxID=2827236 RepID=A0ABS6SA76_9SPHN|nr:type 1 glutamine amidotransferase [Pacificimonas pallii]MBV7255277.1 type 1 glutamine amidotransferase [Pacificimonas pallii]